MKRRDFDRACLRQIAGLKPECNLQGSFGIERPRRGDHSAQEIDAKVNKQVTEAACDYLADRMAALDHAADAGTDTDVADPPDVRDVPIRVHVAIPDETAPNGFAESDEQITARMFGAPDESRNKARLKRDVLTLRDDRWSEAAIAVIDNAINGEQAGHGVRSFHPAASVNAPEECRDEVGARIAWTVQGSEFQHGMLGLDWPPAELPDLELNLEPESPGPR